MILILLKGRRDVKNFFNWLRNYAMHLEFKLAQKNIELNFPKPIKFCIKMVN